MKYCLIFLLLPFSLFAQEEEFKKFEYGVSIGGYKANKYTGVRYDGYDAEYPYDFGVQYYLDLAPSNQYSVYNRIKQSYGDHDFRLGEYPEDIRYNIGLALGLYTGYRTSEFNTFFVSADFVNLSVSDALTFIVDDPSNQTSDELIKVERLTGTEKRLNVNMGFHFGMGDDPDASPYVELAANMTSIRVVKSSMVVQGKEYVLTQWSKNPSLLYGSADYGGIGFGASAGFGYRMRLKNVLLVDIGVTGIYAKMPLGPETLQKFKMQGLGYVRVLLN